MTKNLNIVSETILSSHLYEFRRMIPACIILLTLGTVSAYTFHLIGRLVQVTDSESPDSHSKVTSLGQLWDKEIGESSSHWITLAIFLVCYGTCLAYSIVLGDTFSSLAKSAGFTVRRRCSIIDTDWPTFIKN